MRTRSCKPASLALTLLALAVGLTSCSINPATGKKQFNLFGEGQERQLGQQNDKAIVASFGSYDDSTLQDYVQNLGVQLASNSERPTLDWTFRVVDDPTVNAFALPGGYIYVTRGILAHLDSEAQLAAVVGHEIGHVTARHGVNQQSWATVTQGLLGAGAALSDDVARYGDLLQTATGLVFLKYSRDDERQADDLGLRYVVRTQFDPRPMPEVFTMLARVGESSGSGRAPAWLTSHPAPENRQQRIAAAISTLGQDFSQRTPARARYMEQLEGLVFGEDPRQGFFEDNRFHHPEMRFRLDFPRDWKTLNKRDSVSAGEPAGAAVIQLKLSSKANAAEALAAFISGVGAQAGAPWVDKIGGLPCASRAFTVAQQSGYVHGLAAFIEYRGQVYGLVGYGSESGWNNHAGAVRTALASFRPLTDSAALNAQPKRIKIVRPTRTMSLTQFSRENRATVPVETMALINQLSVDATVRRGRPYKLVVGGRR